MLLSIKFQEALRFIHGNAFRDTRVGIRLDQVGPKVRLSGNTFRGGKAGVLAMNFSRPWIACCEFTALEDGLVATRFSRPLVTNCLFEKNGRGLFAHQKSNFPIRKNLFRGNEKAVFVDLSSYPTIEMNNFEGNGRDIALGIYMSADWEGRVGSGDFSRRRAGSKNSPNLPGIGRSTEFPGEVDARNNWWGERTAREMEEKGEGGNIEAFDDYHDRNEVSYPDWGEGSYRLDRVKYRPWAKEAFPGAGPVPGGCGDFSAEGEEQDR